MDFGATVMSDETDLRLWGTIIGWIVLIFGGGAAWGTLKHKTDSHQKAIDRCKMEDLMTIERCREFHATHQEATTEKLNAIQRTLDEMKLARNRTDSKLGGLTSRIEVIFDRWEQKHG